MLAALASRTISATISRCFHNLSPASSSNLNKGLLGHSDPRGYKLGFWRRKSHFVPDTPVIATVRSALATMPWRRCDSVRMTSRERYWGEEGWEAKERSERVLTVWGARLAKPVMAPCAFAKTDGRRKSAYPPRMRNLQGTKRRCVRLLN